MKRVTPNLKRARYPKEGNATPLQAQEFLNVGHSKMSQLVLGDSAEIYSFKIGSARRVPWWNLHEYTAGRDASKPQPEAVAVQ